MKYALLILWVAASTGLAQPGSIAGRVVDAADGKPIAGASVSLEKPFHVYQREGVASAVTDAQGRFLLRNLKPTDDYFSYSLSAYLDGYLRGDDAAGPPESVTVAPGENVTDVVLPLTRQGLIRGRVSDANGELVQTSVVLWRWHFEAGGRQPRGVPQSFTSVKRDGTFVIGNLAPGTYYLSAGDIDARGNYGTSHLSTTLPVFYGGGDGLPSAKPIEITPGAAINNIDIRLRKGTLYEIRGTVSGLSDKVPVTFNLCAAPGRLFCARISTEDPEGRFYIGGLPAGIHEFTAQAQPRTGQALAASGKFAVGSDMKDLSLTLSAPARVSGEVRGISRERLGGFEPHLAIITFLGIADWAYLKLNQDGAFAQDVQLGQYLVVPRYLPPELYIEAIRSEEKDVTNQVLNLTPAGLKIEVIVRDGAAGMTGSVRDVEKPVAVTIWGDGHTATVMSDDDGEFQFKNLSPGSYRIAAWIGIEKGLAEYPAFFRAFDQQASQLTLTPAARETIVLTAITRKATEAQAAKVR